MRKLNIALLLILGLLFSSQSYAAKITMDRVSSLAPVSSDGQFRVMVEFSNELRSVNSGSVTHRSLDDKDSYLSRALGRQTNGIEHGLNLGGRYIKPNLRTLSVSRAELANLAADSEITVYQDRLHKPSLASSVEVIFPNQSTSAYSGSGQAVAILDTGVANNHAFLSAKIISAAEACFSNGNNTEPFESICPNGLGSMTGLGAGAACDASIDQCSHGTEMAGVIAGGNSNTNGVATSAQIIPVQVFTKISDEIGCSQIGQSAPCVGALESDIISGLAYINSVKNSYSIAAVNLSIESSDLEEGQCDINTPATYLAEIASLVSTGIAVIASSGNGANDNEMASPACISDVIAVAATSDSDTPYSLNNRNSELDFFAPGVAVTTSTLPTSTFVTGSGTSIAAAHVSGSWAVMKSMNPTANVATIKNAFINTGRSVTQGLFTKPRINLTLALGETPPKIELDSSFLPSIYHLLLHE